MLTATNITKGVAVGEAIQAAVDFWPRCKGLLGRRSLAMGEGLLLFPCASIHCLGMRFPIDALFLDQSGQVIALREKMAPGALAACKGACGVLELAAGQISGKNIAVGDRLSFIDNASGQEFYLRQS